MQLTDLRIDWFYKYDNLFSVILCLDKRIVGT